ncbi:hypothetical protein [Mycobacterium camsae]|uniref:hypothetical protein n=1 Tax=Mycobacterium gordonae TaxID=1778 RepID=UPI001F122578|nr:hypothetical protein [Mycobacterium gordonae]
MTSLVVDTINTIGPPRRDSWYVVEQFLFEDGNERLVLENPRFVQITVGFVSAILFGIFYLVLIYAFARGRDWIRLPAVFYAGMVVMGTGVYLAVGILGDAALFQRVCGPGTTFDYKFANPVLSLAYNLPYPLVALLLVARMWRDHPFTLRASQ